MKVFLKKVKIIDYLTTELDMQREEFVSKLKEHVDEGSIGYFSDLLDMFSFKKNNEYKGHVNADKFEIKKRQRLFDTTVSFAVAKGRYEQKENLLVIHTEINGFSKMMIPFYLFAVVVYSFIIGFIFMADNSKVEMGFVFPFLVVHAAFMFGVPYFMMRRSTNRMKYQLEREFYYMTK